MAAKDPWMKFYPQDWRADEKLRMCSLGARGLWIEMLAIMHRSERYGQLLIGGRVPNDAQLAVQVGALPDQVSAYVAELEEAGVFSRTSSGAIYSRRMTRDQKRAETARKNGKKGGNPSLGNKTGKSSQLNQQDKPKDKGGDKPQKPEARSQNKPPSPLDVEKPQEGGEKAYAFSGKTIRLSQGDYDRWELAYRAIPDLRSELTGIDDWLDTADEAVRKRWFHSVSRMLGRKHDEALAASKSKGGAGTDAFIRRMEAFEAKQREEVKS